MTEPARGTDTAGGLLRAAREKQGLHIAALAAAIKVAPRKLDALENNRWDELPDATFTRALAHTVCRTLKVDAKPVLDLLPAVGVGRLENVAGTLNTPFRERGAGSDPSLMGTAVRPMVWASALFLLAALAVFLAPASWWPNGASDGAAVVPALARAPAFRASEVAFPLPDAAVELLPNAPAQTASGAASTAAGATEAPAVFAAVAGSLAAMPAAAGPTSASAAVAAGALRGAAPGVAAPMPTAAATAAPAASADAIQLKAVQPSWVEVRDAQGRVLVSRLVAAGEELAIQGEKPMRLVIGNAAGVELRFRQQRIDLLALTRDNVARLQLP